MLSSSFLLAKFIFIIMVDDLMAQTLSDTTHIPSSQDSSLTNNFQPSLAVVIGMLALMFSLTFLLLLYAKFCHRPSASSLQRHIHDGLDRTRTSLVSGVDKTVVESLPFFRFSSLKGLKQGLECSVCLAKFLDIEILRLLPKCKHAFHMDCIDEWLDKHSTCPLCRRNVTADDLSLLPFSSSFRFLRSQSEESNLELYVEREDNINPQHEYDGGSSSRSFGVVVLGSSFRKTVPKEDELPIQQSMDCDDAPLHHRFNHKINVTLNSRWSNVTSSDLTFLNSEMLNDVSTHRLSIRSRGEQEIPNGLESKALGRVGCDNRSMSEIIIHPRLINDFMSEDSSAAACTVKEERMRKLWLPIATKTAHMFANRHTK